MDEAEEPLRPGIIVPSDSESSDSMRVLAHAVLDEVLYNIIHDVVLKAHREEKIARANTAAILIEQIAASEPPSASASRPRTPHRIETNAATYDDGEVYIRGNPLLTTKETRCPKCNLPKLLYPTSGLGHREPEEEIAYCKRHPYISKPDHDIYGLPFPVEDVKAPRKNAKIKSGSQASSQSASQSLSQQENGTLDSTPPPASSTSVNGRPSFPTTKCSRCSRYIAVRDFRKHLMACMGISSRTSGRAAAAAAVQNKTVSNLNGLDKAPHNSGSTPPISRNTTPAIQIKFKPKPTSMNSDAKVSPSKRDRDEFEEEEDEPTSEEEISDEGPKKKKKLVKKPVLKSGGGGALSRQLGASRGASVVKKWKSGKVTMADGKRLGGMSGGGNAGLGSPRPNSGSGMVGNGVKREMKREMKREASESSQTLSSPS